MTVKGLGTMLRLLREKRGLTQTELAARAGVTQGYIAKLESAEKPPPSADILSRLARALNVQLKQLIAPGTIRHIFQHDSGGRWTVGITPREVHGAWGASVEVWPPGMSPRTHMGLVLTFGKRIKDLGDVIQAAKRSAEDWIERHG